MEVVVAVADMDVDVMVNLDDLWFEWPLYCLYMYLPSLPSQPFRWPPVVLCHSLENLAF